MHLSTFIWILQVTCSVLLVVTKHTAGYSEVCGGHLTQDSGVRQITSPLHPGQYPADVDCTWVIKANEMYVIQLTFNTFNVESCTDCSCDYVLVEDPQSNVTRKFCGSQTPPAITSKKRALILKFHSDGSAVRDGFRATYKFVYDRNCNVNRSQNNSEILSPGYPGRYPDNFDCSWRIEAPLGHIIRLTFSNFDLENATDCRFDYVSVEETEGRNRIRKFCGYLVPPAITSMTNTVILKFHTDGSKNGVGFKARYVFLPKILEDCGVTGRDNNIFSPMYPQQYPPDFDCAWRIKAPEGHTIRLAFKSFELEDCSECTCDYVLVEEREGGERIGKYCGTVAPPVITSSSNTLVVKFSTDNALSGIGFRAKYEFLPKANGTNGTVNSHKSDETQVSIVTRVPHESETVAAFQSRTEQETQTETSRDDNSPPYTPDLSQTSQATDHAHLVNQASSNLEKNAHEGNKTVVIILGVLLGFSILIIAVGFYIYKRQQRSRRNRNVISLKQEHTLDSNSYNSRQAKESVTLLLKPTIIEPYHSGKEDLKMIEFR